MERTRRYLEKGLEVARTSRGVQFKLEAQIKLTSSPSRSSGAVFSKSDAQDAYRLRFGRSLYGWKGNFIELPMAPVSHKNSLGVNGNHRNKLTSRIYPGVASRLLGRWAVYLVEPT